jgi:uncharacterized membrane protein YdbT with pleckstrin-like domain
MRTIERNLMTGERIVFRGRLHAIVFRVPCILFLASIGAFVYLPSQVGWVILAVAGITAIPAAITWFSSEFAVTNKRVIAKVGFFRSHSMELLLSKVEGLTVDQDLFGRILGYGTLGITGTGGTQERFDTIAGPWEFRTKTQEQIAAVQDAAGAR